MGKIRLTGATSGYTELKAAEAAGNNTITLPTTSGGEVIVSDSSGNVNIDSGTLYVDAVNNRVGLGTSSPQQLLHIHNSAAADARLKISNGTTGSAQYDGFELNAGSTGLAGIIQWEQQPIYFYTNNGTAVDPRLVITAAGNVGVGTTSPAEAFTLGSGNAQITSGQLAVGVLGTSGLQFINNGTFGTVDSNPLVFRTVATERARIDTSGRFLVGTSTSAAQASGTNLQQIVSSTNDRMLGLHLGINAATGPYITFTKSRSTTYGSGYSKVLNNDLLGGIIFAGDNGTDYSNQGAYIECYADGEWNTAGDTTDSPSRLVFSTTADGASSPTERMRIRSDGIVEINTTDGGNPTVANRGFVRLYGAGSGDSSYFQSFQGVVAYMNRQGNDGELIQFRQDGAVEGSISVSGTTVSYNGAHLSRWSQLPSGAERTEILRGTVLSNIDEMCEWGDEDNEQLNRMKVSDVEGDKNVAGVFQAWDDDDDTYTNDFYCAMTGDFIIRIAAGVTVERGDLLMSAGDGTAKPQDDDIIRSKTIAKVTSTNVSCTYDDGSYCVPCVLMAC